jgi:hypothetical protein
MLVLRANAMVYELVLKRVHRFNIKQNVTFWAQYEVFVQRFLPTHVVFILLNGKLKLCLTFSTNLFGEMRLSLL